MAVTQTQIRRGTSTEVRAMTPVSSEVVHDTTNKRLHTGDGSTAGGIMLPNRFDVLNNTLTYKAAGGTANAITVTLDEAAAAYTTGMIVRFKAGATNTAATTINVSGLGTKNIYKSASGSIGALVGGEIISGGMYEVAYDGTQFQLLGVAPEATSQAGWELLSIATASSSSTLDFTGLTSTYTNYMFIFNAIVMSAAGGDVWARFSTSASFYATSGQYGWVLNEAQAIGTAANVLQSSGNDSKIVISSNDMNVANVNKNGQVLVNALSGKSPTVVAHIGSTLNAASGDIMMGTAHGMLDASTAQIDGVRFLPSTGTFTSGKIFCYGLRSSI